MQEPPRSNIGGGYVGNVYGSGMSGVGAPPGIWPQPGNQYNFDNMGSENAQRMARASAPVSEVAHYAEHNHEADVYSFEELMKRACGVFFDREPWSVEKHAYQMASQLEGHKFLQTTLVLLGHIYELQQHYEEPRIARALTARAYQLTVQAAVHKGQSEMGWGLLGAPPMGGGLRPFC